MLSTHRLAVDRTVLQKGYQLGITRLIHVTLNHDVTSRRLS